jgi:hypothetical protein
MPYAVTDLKKKAYTGFRSVQEGWELKENETLVESLKGLTELAPPPPPKTPLEKRDIVADSFKQRPLAERVAFVGFASGIHGALTVDDKELALALLQGASQHPNADASFITQIRNIINQ